MNNDFVVFNITDGSSKDRIFDAFKYSRGGEIDLYFDLQEADTQPSGGFCFSIQTYGTGKACACESFLIKSIEYIEQLDRRRQDETIRITGSCDLFYMDANGHMWFESDFEAPEGQSGVRAGYHVDFVMVYNTESHGGTMNCSNFRDCYYDPYDY